MSIDPFVKALFACTFSSWLFFIGSVASQTTFCEAIPAEHVKAIEKGLEQILHEKRAEKIEPLPGGFRSPGIYKVSYGDESLVARFLSLSNIERWEGELYAMNVAAKADVAPPLLYQDAKSGLILMPFIHSTPPPTYSNSLDKEELRALAKTLCKLHGGAPFKNSLSCFDIARSFIENLPEKSCSLILEAQKRFEQLALELSFQSEKKPCHNDLNRGNILYQDNHFFFIDWEFAGQGLPLFDVAALILHYDMSEEQKDSFLWAYFERKPERQELEDLQKMKTAALLFYGFGILNALQDYKFPPPGASEISHFPSSKALALAFGRSHSLIDLYRLGFGYLIEALAPSNC